MLQLGPENAAMKLAEDALRRQMARSDSLSAEFKATLGELVTSDRGLI